MKLHRRYYDLKKPSWAPEPWTFGIVWTVLYVLMGISFGYVLFEASAGGIPILAAIPFVLNLIFNFLYVPIQFEMVNNRLAATDIVLTWVTLALSMAAIFPFAPWVAYINIPYFLWATFAVVLQIKIVTMNE